MKPLTLRNFPLSHVYQHIKPQSRVRSLRIWRGAASIAATKQLHTLGLPYYMVLYFIYGLDVYCKVVILPIRLCVPKVGT